MSPDTGSVRPATWDLGCGEHTVKMRWMMYNDNKMQRIAWARTVWIADIWFYMFDAADDEIAK